MVLAGSGPPGWVLRPGRALPQHPGRRTQPGWKGREERHVIVRDGRSSIAPCNADRQHGYTPTSQATRITPLPVEASHPREHRMGVFDSRAGLPQ
jgi:hypothetical protein